MKLKVKCMVCGTELVSSTRTQVCGCENMVELFDDKISAKNLSMVQIIEQAPEQIDEDRGATEAQRTMNDWQVARSQRKIRKLTFEER